jgi:hypothetical protein
MRCVSVSVTRSRLLLAVVLAGAGACSTAPEPQLPAEPPAVVEPAAPVQAPPEPPAPVEPDRRALRLNIAAVGDMMLGTDFPENHLPDDDGASFLGDVAPVLRAADIAFGNLEGVLVEGGEPAKKCSNPQACYVFRSPPRYAEHYREAGFDVLSLANNHARDFGEDGRTATMQALDAAGIRHSGRAGEFASFDYGGLKVAVLAYAVTKNSNMLLDYELAEATVAEFAADHDVVVVSFHGGAEGAGVTRLPFAEEEYYGEPRGDVVMFARRMVDAGADLVVGHGPHVVRAVERYNDRLIAYSLGNFATYYGISVAGIKGIAPILIATLDGEGRFVEGRVVPTVQIRPAGPSIDPEQRALNLMRSLSLEDFGNPGVQFLPDGRLLPVDRPFIRPHPGRTRDPSSAGDRPAEDAS